MKEKIKKIKISKSQIITIVLAVVFSVSMSLGTSYAADIIFDSKDVGFDNTGTKIQATTVQGAIDELYDAATDYSSMNTRVTTMENSLLDKTYPVGSIYIGVNNTNPSTLFGGTWVAFSEGRTLIGVGTGTDSNSTQKVFASNETGGEYNHTLTVDEMPSHSHALVNYNIWGTTGNSGGFQYYVPGEKTGGMGTNYTNSTGQDQSHNNIPPYITVYMWKRTA